MHEEPSKHEEERALSLEGLWGLFGRNTRLFALSSLGAVAFSFAVLSLRAPSFRARATLILDNEASSAGLLGELAMLGKAPQAASQIELLRARSTAEEVVAAPASSEEHGRRLGLTTLVEDPLLKPVEAAFSSGVPVGRWPARLRASVSGADEHEVPEELEVEFLAGGRVRIESAEWFGGPAALETALGNGAIEFAGCRITLEPEGDLTGRSFRLLHLTRAEAIERVMDATRVRETERNSGVIELTVDDSDPRRAAETANALCQNYLARSEARGARKATSTLGFIQSSLESQLELLRDAEGQVVEVQRENPRAINVTKSAEILIEQLSGLEVQRVQAQLALEGVRQALALLRGGDMAGLARMTAELSDPITASYLESLARLDTEHSFQARSDSGPYKLLLQEHELAVQGTLDALELELARLGETAAAIERREPDATARLGGGPPAGRDPLLESYLGTLGELQSRNAELARTATAEHPGRIENAQRIEATVGLIAKLLHSRIEGLESQRREQLALLASYRARRDGFPTEERARIDAARDGLRERTAQHLEGRSRGLQGSLDDLSREIARVERTLGALPEEERVVAEPLRKLAAHTEIVKLLLAKEQEAEISRAATQPSAEFVDPAVAPLERSSPSVPLHLGLGALLGVLAGCALAGAKEALFRGVFTESELERAADLPVLGAIPDFRRGRYRVRRAGEHFVPLRDDPEGPSAEAYRSLRANLKFALTGEREVRSLATTSCTPGEGKSSTNVALAMAFARSGRKVLLVDCDMRRPSVHSYLGRELAPGLSDVLEGRSGWREAVARGVQERLDVLSAGEQPRSPGDLLDGQGFAELLGELEREYDLVICDVPPAIAVSDIESCAARIDALLLVVRSDKVAARVVEQTARRLKQSGANLIGAILNGVGTSIANGKYGYGYGYGYGKRADSERRAS